MRQDTSMVSDAGDTLGQHEIPLRVDVDEDLPPLRPDHLEYHPSTSFPGLGDSLH
jgi:hypothetical protein